VPDVLLPGSPVAPGVSPVRIHVRDAGEGPAVVLLHGGWGYEAYPYDAAIAALAPRHRVLAPDRVGYGRSGRLAALPRGFHRRMAEETFALLDALGIRSAALWGHSDGAVVSAWAAILRPERVRAVVLEALHVVPAKVSSVEFFETAVEAPERFGDAVVEALRRDHGDGWREVVGAGGRAWLDLIAEGRAGRPDLYDGRLGEIRAPVLVLHGRRDPRTEPGEIERALAAIPGARLALVDAAHCPHASAKDGARANAEAVAFLDADR
jgi:pimeloyl-ACP methyl ester carboxylesterase